MLRFGGCVQHQLLNLLIACTVKNTSRQSSPAGQCASFSSDKTLHIL